MNRKQEKALTDRLLTQQREAPKALLPKDFAVKPKTKVMAVPNIETILLRKPRTSEPGFRSF